MQEGTDPFSFGASSQSGPSESCPNGPSWRQSAVLSSRREVSIVESHDDIIKM